tara:strand:- start:3747 stop:4154 length:408 start_codon:yes stop_codon:yes gene_type:complete
MANKQEQWRESFIEAMEKIQDGNPDGAVLVLGATHMDSELMSEFPCAVGGRNMDTLTHEMQEHMVSAILRSAFELCVDFAGSDNDAGKRVFESALKMAFDFNMTSTETVALDRPEPTPEDMAEQFKHAMRNKMSE